MLHSAGHAAVRTADSGSETKGNGTASEEQRALAEFVRQVRSALKDKPLQAWLFGSTARNDRWKAEQQMRSEMDVLVIARAGVGKEGQQLLIDATYPLLLMCGSTISPQFRSLEWMNSPPNAEAKDFIERLEADAFGLFPKLLRNQRFRRGKPTMY